MNRLAATVVAHRRSVLLAWAAIVAGWGALGMGLGAKLATRGYTVPGSESDGAATVERKTLYHGEHADVFVAVTPRRAEPLRVVLVRARTAIQRQEQVAGTGRPIVGRGGSMALVPVRLGVDVARAQKKLPDLRGALRKRLGGTATVELLGQAAVFERYSTIAKDDLKRAESI